MANKRKGKQKRRGPSADTSKQKPQRVERGKARAPAMAVVGPGRRALGLLLMLVSVGATLVLILHHFGGMRLPGCAPGSGCDQAAASVWGKLPWVNWPVSFIGFAYFAGALVAWWMSRPGTTPAFRRLVRLGAAASVFFIIVMFAGGYVCHWCLLAHGGNLAFWLVVETTPAAVGLRPHALAGLVGVFLVASAALGIVQTQTKRQVIAGQESELTESTGEIIRGRDEPGATDPAPADEPFTGRYHTGPIDAPIRIVVFTDYQCTECNGLEDQFRQVAERDDVSLSVKHFPFCSDCNRRVPNRMHPNACWGARAAEAAGMLGGDDGFFAMHNWLFEVDGSFTDAELQQRVRELGYDVGEFLRLMEGAETLALVKQDVEEATAVGLWRTPMIFINGVELRGWLAPNAVVRAVNELALTDPPSRSPRYDRPVSALEKYIEDWRQGFPYTVPQRPRQWSMGPADAPVQITLFGGYEEPYTQEVATTLRRVASERGDVHLVWRHYPMNNQCNPVVTRSIHPAACIAAQAAEAAGIIGGEDAFWAMHDWLMSHRNNITPQTLRGACGTVGLDPQQVFETMATLEVAQRIAEDCADAKRVGLNAIPWIIINGRRSPHTRLEGQPFLERLVEAAAQDAAAAGGE